VDPNYDPSAGGINQNSMYNPGSAYSSGAQSGYGSSSIYGGSSSYPSMDNSLSAPSSSIYQQPATGTPGYGASTNPAAGSTVTAYNNGQSFAGTVNTNRGAQSRAFVYEHTRRKVLAWPRD
jgi:hypothetical protein